MNELLWIALPGGVAQTRPRLRVLVVARLDGATVQDCGMSSWPPAALQSADTRLLVEWRADAEAPIATASIGAADLQLAAQPGLWGRLFPPG